MFTACRLSLCLASLLCLSTALSAQEQRSVAGPISSPVITGATAGEKVRFSSPPSTCQMRVQILSTTGDPLLDSAWKDGNVLDWPTESPAQPLANGSYRCVVMVKDLEGQVIQKEATLTAQDGQVSIQQRGGSEALTVLGAEENGPKITMLAHDGKNGSIVSTGGDLSFRFGNFLAGKDNERMRLTADGDLTVNGLIRANAVQFPDGTTLTSTGGGTAAGQTPGVARPGTAGSFIVGTVANGLKPLPGTTSRRLRPGVNTIPTAQFVVGDTGVSVGTTNPAYNLNVAGTVNTNAGYNLGGSRILSADLAGNASVGYSSGALSGGSNSFFGTQSGQANTTSSGNSFFGYQSGTSNSTGTDNAFFGLFAGVFTNANFNSFFGSNAGFTNSTGINNTGIGGYALYSSTGSNNIGLGRNAGQNLTSGGNNIDIGNSGVAAEASTIRIGTGGVQTRTFIAGIRGVTVGGDALNVVIDSTGQLGTAALVLSSRRYKFDINDMDQVTDGLMRLRPVTFRYLAQGDNAPLQYGLIAEEVAEVYPEMVVRNKDGQVETVNYQFLAPMLLNHVQKQQRQIEEQQKTIEALNATREKQQTTIESLNATIEAFGRRLQALEKQAARSR